MDSHPQGWRAGDTRLRPVTLYGTFHCKRRRGVSIGHTPRVLGVFRLQTSDFGVFPLLVATSSWSTSTVESVRRDRDSIPCGSTGGPSSTVGSVGPPLHPGRHVGEEGEELYETFESPVNGEPFTTVRLWVRRLLQKGVRVNG